MTLRFFPQSFERSTLGGWIATRAAGHFATGPTHIDDLVESIRAITPRGEVWESRRLPASGAGPSPDRLLLGSEGTLAVITEAWVRIRPRDEPRWSGRVELDDFAVGLELIREIVQSGLRPSNCRLVEAREAQFTLSGDRTTLHLGFEGAHEPVAQARAICERYGTMLEGGGGAWRDAFLRAPYLRDTLVAMGVLVETFETAVTWDRLPGLIEAVKAAVPCMCRITHAYPDGAAPYFTVVAPARRGEEEEQWAQIKRAAADAVLAGGGTITHHHAVGRDHRPVVRPPAPGAVRRRSARRQGGARPGRPPQPGGTLGLMPNVDASAKNMQAVCKAKDVHDRSCPWGGKANRVHLSWFDLERIGWEEGDVICGLIVVGDEKVSTGMMRVTCDAEPDGGKEEAEEEVVEAVSERELVTVSPSETTAPR